VIFKFDYVKILFTLLFISFNLSFILKCLFYFVLYSNYCVISKSYFCVVLLFGLLLALTLPTGGGRSVGIVRSRTKAMEFSFIVWMLISFEEFGYP
jgi:hypothetical protein